MLQEEEKFWIFLKNIVYIQKNFLSILLLFKVKQYIELNYRNPYI